MNDQQKLVAEQCAAKSLAGEIHFGEVVCRLMEAGIERYHADYSRMENTYYLASGASHVVPIGHASMAGAEDFSASAVAASVRQAQRGEIKYPQFVDQTCAAGCIGYFVQIAGKCVQYFGRKGEIHTEWFPGAGPK
ncbi:MAG: DUF1398 family protein [Tepidisphaeraceae bacterium]